MSGYNSEYIRQKFHLRGDDESDVSDENEES